MENILLAIIGGSGLYSMPGLTDAHEYILQTPFGKTSSPIIVGSLEGQRVAFLARHGIGHHLTPGEVPYRANIYALKIARRRTCRQHQRLRLPAGRLCAG